MSDGVPAKRTALSRTRVRQWTHTALPSPGDHPRTAPQTRSQSRFAGTSRTESAQISPDLPPSRPPRDARPGWCAPRTVSWPDLHCRLREVPAAARVPATRAAQGQLTTRRPRRLRGRAAAAHVPSGRARRRIGCAGRLGSPTASACRCTRGVATPAAWAVVDPRPAHVDKGCAA